MATLAPGHSSSNESFRRSIPARGAGAEATPGQLPQPQHHDAEAEDGRGAVAERQPVGQGGEGHHGQHPEVGAQHVLLALALHLQRVLAQQRQRRHEVAMAVVHPQQVPHRLPLLRGQLEGGKPARHRPMHHRQARARLLDDPVAGRVAVETTAAGR
jgi:hypothetical protein